MPVPIFHLKYQNLKECLLLRVPPLKFPCLPCSLLPSLLPCSSPSLGCSLPSHSLLPPLAYSLLSFPRYVHASFRLFLTRSIINPPSLIQPSSLHSRSPSHIITSSLPPTPCSLHPSHLPFSLAPSLPLDRCVPACLLSSNSINTVCVYSVGELH